MTPRIATAVLFCAGWLSGCSAAGVQVDYGQRTVRARTADRDVRYRFGAVPDTWRPLSVEGNDAAWHDTVSDGTVHVDHSCDRQQDVPLQALVQHLLSGFTERSFVLEETVPFDGREARHVVVHARLDGRPVALELYVLKKDGCVFDLGYSAVRERFESGQAAFRDFVRGFSTVDTGASPGVRSTPP